MYEPYRNGSPSTGVWEQWNAVNDGKLFGFALDGNNAPDTTCSPNSDYWNLFSSVTSAAGSPRLLHASRMTAELGGTPIVAGNEDGNDPAITLTNFEAQTATGCGLHLAALVSLLALLGTSLHYGGKLRRAP